MTNKEAIYIINNRLNTYYCTDEDLQALDLAIKALEDRPQGEWIKDKAYYDECAKSIFYKCTCSICGITQSFYEDNETSELYSFNYCPNCGAKMKGGAEE